MVQLSVLAAVFSLCLLRKHNDVTFLFCSLVEVGGRRRRLGHSYLLAGHAWCFLMAVGLLQMPLLGSGVSSPKESEVTFKKETREQTDINTLENRMLMLDGMPAVRVKAELLESGQGSPSTHSYPDMEAVPLLLNSMKADSEEDSLPTDHFQTQTEPVDLSINKARSSPIAASSSPVSITASASSPSSISTSSSRPASSPTVITSVSSAASAPSVLTPGPLVASASGVGGQQFLHIIHPVPPSSPMNLQTNKMSHVHRIPVVVQSVPVVYTAVRSPGNVNNTIVVPLLEDGRNHMKAQMDPRGLSPRQIKSDSDDDDLPNVTLDSVNETGSTALSIARAVQE
nr:Krueppel-like factor 12 [Anolis sagrei ordinatus]